MTLAELFRPLPAAHIHGDAGVEIRGMSLDSRQVCEGDLFVALRGERMDGNQFAEEAVTRGAHALLAETCPTTLPVPIVTLPEPRSQIGHLACRLYGEPALSLTVVGITGTNGKTTVAHLVESILNGVGRRAAYLGTTGYRWGGVEEKAVHTTPEASDLHRMLSEMRDARVTDVVLECSSHGLDRGRLNGLDLDVAVFTNLTGDHLDYHGSLERYRDAKWKLFRDVLGQSRKPVRTAVINLDDETGRDWANAVTFPVITFSLHDPTATLTVLEQKLRPDGFEITVGVGARRHTLRSPLVGAHNISNVLAAAAVALALGIPPEKAFVPLAAALGAPGRLELVPNSRGFYVFVDYAHTDDALRNVLGALDPLRRRRLLVVFGCGGDRDRTKRPRMAATVSAHADVALLTSDNPRSEDPEKILSEMEAGISGEMRLVAPETLDSESRGVACRIVDRREAIRTALQMAAPEDLILIAGKGHETHQEIAGQLYPFDDRTVAREILEGLS